MLFVIQFSGVVHFPRRVRFTLLARAMGVKMAEHALFAWNRRQTDVYDFSRHRKSVNLFLNYPNFPENFSAQVNVTVNELKQKYYSLIGKQKTKTTS